MGLFLSSSHGKNSIQSMLRHIPENCKPAWLDANQTLAGTERNPWYWDVRRGIRKRFQQPYRPEKARHHIRRTWWWGQDLHNRDPCIDTEQMEGKKQKKLWWTPPSEQEQDQPAVHMEALPWQARPPPWVYEKNLSDKKQSNNQASCGHSVHCPHSESQIP